MCKSLHYYLNFGFVLKPAAFRIRLVLGGKIATHSKCFLGTDKIFNGIIICLFNNLVGQPKGVFTLFKSWSCNHLMTF